MKLSECVTNCSNRIQEESEPCQGHGEEKVGNEGRRLEQEQEFVHSIEALVSQTIIFCS